LSGFDIYSGQSATGTITQASAVMSGKNSPVQSGAHIGALGIVLIAALGLLLLDRAGFRFMVTLGKR
jgi:hypothetical protein